MRRRCLYPAKEVSADPVICFDARYTTMEVGLSTLSAGEQTFTGILEPCSGLHEVPVVVVYYCRTYYKAVAGACPVLPVPAGTSNRALPAALHRSGSCHGGHRHNSTDTTPPTRLHVSRPNVSGTVAWVHLGEKLVVSYNCRQLFISMSRRLRRRRAVALSIHLVNHFRLNHHHHPSPPHLLLLPSSSSSTGQHFRH